MSNSQVAKEEFMNHILVGKKRGGKKRGKGDM